MAKKWLLLGIPVIFIVSAFVHFIYELSGKSIIVGMFAPVNESPWEHLKLSFFPMLIWWALGYFIINKKSKISLCRWITSCAVAVLVCPAVILSIFYSYTGAFGIKPILFIDIFSLLLAITIANCLAIHTYEYMNCNCKFTSLFVSISIIILLASAFIIFTFYPPHIPLFWSSPTKTYGI